MRHGYSETVSLFHHVSEVGPGPERWLFVPAHPRDLEQMVFAAREHWVTSLQRPIVLARLRSRNISEQAKRRYKDILPSAHLRFYSNPLARTRVDGLTPLQIRRIVRKIRRDFLRIDRIVISDFFFVCSEFVRQLKAVYSAQVVFVPEGVGALRVASEQEPFRFLGWQASVRALLGDVKDAVWLHPVKGGLAPQLVEHGTALLRAAALMVLRPPAPENVRLDFIETLVMPAGRSTEAPIRYGELREFSFGKKQNPPNAKIGLFIHQPFAMEPRVWETMMRTAKEFGVERIVLKQHQVADGWLDLVEAAGRVFEHTQIQQVREGLVERLVDECSAGLVFGITSTALGNIAAEPGVSRRVISFVALAEEASEGSKPNAKHLQHQANWLRETYGGKIEFL